MKYVFDIRSVIIVFSDYVIKNRGAFTSYIEKMFYG